MYLVYAHPRDKLSSNPRTFCLFAKLEDAVEYCKNRNKLCYDNWDSNLIYTYVFLPVLKES